MRISLVFILLSVCIAIAAPSKKAPAKASAKKFKDPRDGHTYRIVKIGNHNWLAENLRDGDLFNFILGGVFHQRLHGGVQDDVEAFAFLAVVVVDFDSFGFRKVFLFTGGEPFVIELLQVFDFLRGEFDDIVGHDAVLVDGLAVFHGVRLDIIVGDGELEGAAVVEIDDVLDGAFAICLCAVEF